jgi:exodeoxyribonuclease-3
MRFATFNVNSLRARFPVLVRFVEKAAPDILCLQETKVRDELFPLPEFEELGYRVVYRGEKSYNGVAIATRSPVQSVRFGLDDGLDGPDEPRIVAVHLDGIDIVNTYVPQGHSEDSPKFQYKLRWFERLLAYFQRHYSVHHRLLWTGDLNVAPSPLDVHDPKGLLGHVCYHPEVHQRFQALMDWGFVDVFRKHRPDPGEFSFYDYRVPNAMQRKLGWRIDHLLATPALAQHSRDAWIDLEPRTWEKPSDHAPVLCDLDI